MPINRGSSSSLNLTTSSQLSAMSERRVGFRFHAQTHSPPTSHFGPPKPNPEPIKSHENSVDYSGGRRFGFPSTMFQRGEMNHACPDQNVITEGGWVRPSSNGWSLPPDEPLVPTVKNVNTNIRRSLAVIAGGGDKLGWGSGQALPAMKKGTRLETIDSSEAAKKYGGRFMF